MGFGAVAQDIFAGLDRHGSGRISYRDLSSTLAAKPPVSRAAKEMLTSLMWNVEAASVGESVCALDTSDWVVEGDSAPEVSAALRQLLLASGAPISEIIGLFDEDADDECRIDDIEFFKAMRTTFKYVELSPLLCLTSAYQTSPCHANLWESQCHPVCCPIVLHCGTSTGVRAYDAPRTRVAAGIRAPRR